MQSNRFVLTKTSDHKSLHSSAHRDTLRRPTEDRAGLPSAGPGPVTRLTIGGHTGTIPLMSTHVQTEHLEASHQDVIHQGSVPGISAHSLILPTGAWYENAKSGNDQDHFCLSPATAALREI